MRLITEAAPKEADQWVLIETICLAVGLLHGRTNKQLAEFVDTVADRITQGKR